MPVLDRPYVTCVRWWPGRTDEVRRVADRLRKLGQPDGDTTNGELAARTSTDAAIVADAIDMNAAVADALASQCPRTRITETP